MRVVITGICGFVGSTLSASEAAPAQRDGFNLRKNALPDGESERHPGFSGDARQQTFSSVRVAKREKHDDLRRFDLDPDHLEAVKRDLDKWTATRKQKREASGKEKIPSRRLSLKLAPGTGKRMTAVLNKTGWNKTSLVRSVVMSVEKDILKNKARKPVLDLQEIAAAVNA